jgi:hypothetical protein
MYTCSIIVFVLAGFTSAGPVVTRQLIGGTGTTSNEFSRGGCKDILFAWARGSTEIGNMVGGSLILFNRTVLSRSGDYRWSSYFRWPEEEFRSECRRH